MSSLRFLAIWLLLVSCNDKDSFTSEGGEASPQSGLSIEEALDYKPEMIGPGIISTGSFEGHASISPDQRELYFTIYNNDHSYSTIVYSVKIGKDWAKPHIVSFSGRYSDGSPALSPDGTKLFFSSNRPTSPMTDKNDTDIWVVERTTIGWGEPIHLGSPINTEFTEFSPSVDSKGNLYFCSNRPGGLGDMDIYESAFSNGHYEIPVNLGDSINSEYREGNVGVSPDGTLLFLMAQHKPGDYGYDDIHYSFKMNNRWSRTRNIGEIVNTGTYDFSPKVSPDGSYLYFSSRLNRDFRRLDQTAYTYSEYQRFLQSPLNGFGNIYRIKITELNLD